MRIMPGNLSPTAAPPLTERTLVTYEHQGSLYIGAVKTVHRDKFTVMNDRGREGDFPSSRLHPLPGRLPSDATSLSDTVAYLNDLLEQSERITATIQLEELWSVVKDEIREYGNGELSELLFEEDSIKNHLALRRALIADRVYFKRKREFFEPRSAEVVEELFRAEEARKRKLEINEKALAYLNERKRDRALAPPIEIAGVLNLLLETAAGCPLNPSQQKEAKEFLQIASQTLDIPKSPSKERQSYALLRTLGFVDRQTNLSLIRHGLDTLYPESVLEEAQSLSSPTRSSEAERYPSHRDLTHLPCLTIDDASTRDMDDALSLVRTEEGFQLGIHISDVASLIAVGSNLDRHARVRTTSVYCPERSIHMLPPIIAEDLASLVQGKARPCLSYLLSFTSTLELISWELTPSIIEVKRRFDYDSVDQILEQGEAADSEVHWMYQIALTLEALRFASGGFKVHKRDTLVGVDDRGKVTLCDIDENGPARSLIGEMMILANERSAQFAQENNIPFIYRSQEPPESPSSAGSSSVPDGPALDYLSRQGLKPSVTSTSAASHHTLGLKLYAQATSPIRRYTDLLNQRQLLAFLKGEELPYNVEQMEQAIADVDQYRGPAVNVSKDSRRYWILEYLRQRRKSHDRITGTVIRTDLKHPLVELDECYISTILRTKETLRLGDQIELRLVHVDPVFDELKLEYVGNRQ